MEIKLPENYPIFESAISDLKKLSNMGANDIKSAYLANVLAALVLKRVGDRFTDTLLADIEYKNLTKYNGKMSIVNFWGLLVHNSECKSLSHVLSSQVIKDLKETTGRILRPTVKDIHDQLSTKKKINWDNMIESVRILSLRLSLRNARVNNIRDGLENWNDLDIGARTDVISNAFYYLTQNDSSSPLVARLSAIANSNLLAANKHTGIVKKVTKLDEEGEVAAASDVAVNGTTSGDVASVPYRLFGGKIIRRIKRQFIKRKPYEKRRRKK